MNTSLYYLAACGVLTILLWTPYILSRIFVWGLPTFLNNYPQGYPATQPESPIWAQRAQRAHLNMVETMPAFIAVITAAVLLPMESQAESIGQWAEIFFFARLGHALVYILGVPYLRTPTYLLSWFAILSIAAKVLL
jgi:uncharacterized MAPEG superfamily protein